MPLFQCTTVLAVGLSVILLFPTRVARGARHRTAAKSEEASVEPRSREVPYSCAVTQPPEPAFVPPPPYPDKVREGGFWFGSEKLWTRLRTDGVWHGVHTQTGYGDKLFLFSVDFDVKKTEGLRLTVTGRRRDAGAPPFIANAECCSSDMTRHYPFVVAGVDIPTAGCWEITAENQGDKLSFVVWVSP
jgi:hypothetical protein